MVQTPWLRRCTWVAVAAIALYSASIGSAAPDQPVPLGQQGAFELLGNWTFGTHRADATIHNKAELDRDFYYRYINEGGKLDGIPTYWTYHRDYPEADPRSLHVFGEDSLTLKGRIPAGGGLWPRGIESGILRAKLPISPGMYVEMRAKLPYGLGAWPAFWLTAGVQYENGNFSDTPWPPEIDIFEFFNWQGRTQTRVMTGNVQSNGKREKFGNPHDVWTKFVKGEYVPGADFSAAFHVFALDWRKDEPVWLLDGIPIKQTHYEWNGPPAHLLITNQIGMKIPGANLTGMLADESQWNYIIDYVRVWRRRGEPPPLVATPPSTQ
jgi:Glycosyl hydrolases family 16